MYKNPAQWYKCLRTYILFPLLSGQSNNILAHMIIVASEFVFLRFLFHNIPGKRKTSLKPYTFNHAGFHVNVLWVCIGFRKANSLTWLTKAHCSHHCLASQLHFNELCVLSNFFFISSLKIYPHLPSYLYISLYQKMFWNFLVLKISNPFPDSSSP